MALELLRRGEVECVGNLRLLLNRGCTPRNAGHHNEFSASAERLAELLPEGPDWFHFELESDWPKEFSRLRVCDVSKRLGVALQPPYYGAGNRM